MAEARRINYSSSKTVPAYYKATINNNNTLSKRKTSGANAIADWAPTNKHKCMISPLITIATRSMTTQNRKVKTIRTQQALTAWLTPATRTDQLSILSPSSVIEKD